MPEWSASSRKKLDGVHPELRTLFDKVVQYYDCQVLEGERSFEQQQANVANGVSETMDSKHLKRPAEAVDVAPYPVVWPKAGTPGYHKDLGRFYYFGGFVLGIAEAMRIPLRWGGDWDSDRDVKDQSFDDLVHFELMPHAGPF